MGELAAAGDPAVGRFGFRPEGRIVAHPYEHGDQSDMPLDERSGSVSQSSGLDDLLEDLVKAPRPIRLGPPELEHGGRPLLIGPYQLEDLLGQGGMGQVWRARHRQTGDTVALKTLRTSSESQLRSLRREIHALARLQHPGIVRILDEGVEQGVPWYAMELLEGHSLHRWRTSAGRASAAPTPPADTETWWTVSLERTNAATPTPDELRQRDRPVQVARRRTTPRPASSVGAPGVLDLMRRLCAPLAYLHGEGLVHCDLKPGNVVVRADGMPVLVDFGLTGMFAAGLSREALDLRTSASGTVAYMAPEQIRGELLDARADLYALGCILYEMLTGRPPFVGKTSLDVLEQHLDSQPMPTSSVVEGISPDLDLLVLRLLEKEPRRRIGHADDVAAALASLGAEAGPESAAEPPRVYLYRPGLLGREQPMRRLQERVIRLQEQDTGGLVLLGGESGVGKTRLLMEFGREVGKRRLQALEGECQDISGRPLEPLLKPLQAVADRCRARGELETERLLGRRGKVLSLYEPSLKALPGQELHPEPVTLPPDAARLRLYGDLLETLAAFAEDVPLVLVLDDLQWADELTLGFLEYCGRTLPVGGVALLLVGAYRVEEAGETLGDLLGCAGVESLRLGRLEESAVAAMVAEMLALDPAPALFSRFLARQSEGNPFFVAEYLRTALAEGVLWRDERGLWQVAGPDDRPAAEADYEALPLPHSLHELVNRRLESLGSDARQMADVGSVLGREFEEPLLGVVAGMESSRLMEATRELLARQVFEETRPGVLRFAHDKLREVAHDRIGSFARSAVHRAAAEAIEAGSVVRREEHLAALGHHWQEAGVRGRARDCYLAGARRAKERYAFAEAERLYQATLSLLDEPSAEGVAARNELALEVLYVQARIPEAIPELERALREARELGERGLEAATLRALGATLLRQGRVEEARGYSEQGLPISRAVGDRRVEAGILVDLAVCCDMTGGEDGLEMWNQALAAVRSTGDARSVGIVLGNHADFYRQRGAWQNAREAYEQALGMLRAAGDRRNEAILLGNLALLHDDQGNLDEARSLFEQAVSLHRGVGARQSEGIALGNLASLHIRAGRLDEAKVIQEQALAIHRIAGNRQHEGLALGNLAEVYGQQGRVEEAEAMFEQAVTIIRGVGEPRVEGGFQRAAATLSRRCQRDVHHVEALLDRAELLLAEVQVKQQFALCRCERAHLALVRGIVDSGLVAEAELTATSLALRPESELVQAVGRVRRAQEAFEAGQHGRLFQGELIEDFPAGLRRWLVEAGRLTRERALLPMD